MDRILIIEDSKVMQAQLKDSLEGRFRLVMKEDGPPGIAEALEAPPDLILLDIYLAQMDGFDVCRVLKNDPRTRDIPLIFLTSLQSEQEKIRGFEAGADDYIVKPFYPGELLARINLHLASRREKAMAVELERLNLLQEMAVALNHEFNNPLTTVFCLLHLASKELPEESGRVGERLVEIRDELEKIRRVTNKLANASQIRKTDYVRGEEMIDLHDMSPRPSVASGGR